MSVNVIDVFESVVKKVLGSDELVAALRVIEAFRAEHNDTADACLPEPLPEVEAPAPVIDARDVEIENLRKELAAAQAKPKK